MKKYIHPVKFHGAKISPKAKLFDHGKKNKKKGGLNYENPQNKSINRFWGNATRLEHSNVRNKNKGKKR